MIDDTIYDVAIIGAGPAGTVLAKHLPDKHLALIDARALDLPYNIGDKTKSCGGLLAPDAQKQLKKLGINIPNELISQFQPTKGIKTTDFDARITRYYQRNYLNIDREAFDRYLLRGIKADQFFNTTVNTIADNGRYFVINNRIKAKIIVGADGAGSIVRRRFFKHFKPRQYVSIQEVYKHQTTADFECFFDKSTSDYYGWALPKDGHYLLGYAIPEGADCRTKFKNFKKRLNMVEKPVEQQGTLIIRPGFFHPITCNSRVFLIGEAGGYISPSSAEGISYAVKTAKILADSHLDAKKFRQKMRWIQLDIFYKNLKSIAMYTPWIRHLIMRL